MRRSRIDAVPGKPNEPIAISLNERDALFKRIALRLNGIDAVRIATEDEDWGKAAELGQEFGDLLALVSIDLGWGEGEGEEFELRTPPEVLARAIQAVEREAQADYEIDRDDLLNAQQAVGRAEMLLKTCRRITSALHGVAEKRS